MECAGSTALWIIAAWLFLGIWYLAFGQYSLSFPLRSLRPLRNFFAKGLPKLPRFSSCHSPHSPLQFSQPAKGTWLTSSPLGSGFPVTPEKHVRNVAYGSIPSPALNIMKTLICRPRPAFGRSVYFRTRSVHITYTLIAKAFLRVIGLRQTPWARKTRFSKNCVVHVSLFACGAAALEGTQGSGHVTPLFDRKNNVLPDNPRSDLGQRIPSANAFVPEKRLPNG